MPPFPWMALAVGIPALIQALGLGGRGRQEQVTETEVPPAGYQSPLLGFADPMVFETLLRRMQSFGAPSQMLGGTAGAGYSPWIDDMIAMLGREWPTLMGGVGGRGRGEARPGTIIRPSQLVRGG